MFRNETDKNAVYSQTSSFLARQHYLYEHDTKSVSFDASSATGYVITIEKSANGVNLFQEASSSIAPVAVNPLDFTKFLAESQYKERFEKLSKSWKEETIVISSLNDIAAHPAYQSIIGMGEPAVPLILADLGKTQSKWFWALKAISGEDPVPADKRGIIPEMVFYWLAWGRSKGYVR